MRLGVGAALIDGSLVPGDVHVDAAQLRAVGLPGSGSDIAVPGLVDLQVNGFGGVDLCGADAAGYQHAGQALLATGVTAYQPTFITADPEHLLDGLRSAGAVASPAPRVLGVHLEGPFLSPQRLGTHPQRWQRSPEVPLLARLLAAGPLRSMTLAPELGGALEVVGWLSARGVVVSAGHTDATASEAHAAFDAGVRTVTHLLNAMRPLRPRDPGLAAVALTRSDVVVQLIVDGLHVAPDMVALVRRAAPGRVALVTDAVAAAGVGDGRYRLGDVAITVVDGVARRADGTLAGSTLTMDAAVRGYHALGASLEEAVSAATAIPARILGRRDVGTLTLGGRADVTVLDDRLEVRRVLVGGAIAHARS